MVAADGTIDACDPSFAALAGMVAEDLVGRRLDEVLVGDERLLSPGAAVQRFSATLHRADGERLAITVRQFPRREDGTDAGATWVLVTDAPPRVAAVPPPRGEEGVRESQGAVEMGVLRASFLRAVAHDLKNPLSIITGMGHTLADRQSDLPPDVRIELAEAIARQGGRLLSTLENLLALDRIALGRTRLRRLETDVAALIEQTLEALRDERVEVRTDLVPLSAWVDVTLLERVVENLVRNAAEHQLTDQPIEVHLCSAVRDPERFEIRVFDRGPGIDPEVREQIFRPYFRGDRRGVGLSIVRAFTRMHGGDVTIEDRPGGGSVFVVSLPVDEDAAA